MEKFESLVVFCFDGGGTLEEMRDYIWLECSDLSFDIVFGGVGEGFDGRIWRKLKVDLLTVFL